jgi:hypothetical protein
VEIPAPHERRERMTSLWEERLARMRQQEWVGREAEIEWFQEALAASEWLFPVWMVTGPPGIGKTALLQRYAGLCRENGIPTIEIDARTLDAHPASFLQTLQPLWGETSDGASGSPRMVLLIDHYERLMPLDPWLRHVFFPRLPQSVLLLLASREPPSRIWPRDPGWSGLIRLVRLGNLSGSEAREYLERRGIPAEEQPAILEFAHGHPLALCLAADWALQHGQPFRSDAAPEVVQMLRQEFLPEIPGPSYQAALEACAMMRALTEDLLGELVDSPEDLPGLFAWLQQLPLLEMQPQGLALSDVVREVLLADLRWRKPERFVELHQRARSAYIRRLRQGPRALLPRFLLDCVYLHRMDPRLRPFLRWENTGSIHVDGLRAEDRPRLVAMVEHHEGHASAALAAEWLALQPHGTRVMRAPSGEALGFMMWITLPATGEAELLSDPAVRAALAYLERASPLRPGERVTLFRFWMARETYQAVSDIQTLCFVCAVQHHLTTSGLSFSFFPCADPEFWEPVFNYMGMERLPAADFEVGGHRYGVYGQDWRAVPPAVWLSRMAEQEGAFQPASAALPEQAVPPVHILQWPEFEAAVREALRGFVRPELLRTNPLLYTRMVLDQTGPGASLSERVTALRVLLMRVLASWEAAPRARKLYEALRVTYLQPAPTQEQAAERLDLPFSTYRRHLKQGIARLCQQLWEWELGQTSPPAP